MLKPILQTLILAAGMLSPAMASGGILTADEAKEVAAGFFREGDVTRLADVDALTLAHVENSGSGPSHYIFNAADGMGFIIVSADDNKIPVIAYSTTSSWQTKSVPGAAELLLENANIPDKSSARKAPVRRAASTRKILSTPTWSQEAPFNNMIPNRRLVGCVGTALAEIIRYHRYPANRPASLVKPGEPTAYDWDNMLDGNYRSGYTAVQGDAVAALMADAAISIGTDFGMSSSSAFEVKVPAALVGMFGYDAGVSYKKSAEMDRESWEALVISEIDADRPVLYCGQDVSVGHAFVCDGYEVRGSTSYLHMNWGWGGAADGFYATDMLNPTVSMTHNFSYLATVVYNIKPATSTAKWSPIHITSDEKQIGLTVDVTDFKPGATVSVRAGALKNITNDDFSGKVSLALFNSDGSFKQLLGEGRNLNIISLQIVKYIDFTCTVPADANVGKDDVVRLVTKDNASSEWLPVAGDLMTIGEVRAQGNAIPYFNINMPASVEGIEISCPEPRVIKGRDFTFKVMPTDADKVVTVKANGFILTPSADNSYRINNVITDQEITIIVQNAADVVSKRVLWVQAGRLSQLISEVETASISDLTLFGTIDVNDFTFMREHMKLTRLDISEVNIAANGANPANAIPAKAFSGCGALQQIILPKNVNSFKSGCFSYSGLRSIEIPASVATYEYNIFLGCSKLSEVTVRRSSPAWINWCVFSGVPKSKLIVPVNATAAYQSKENWKDFKNIVEENPTVPSEYSVTLQDASGVKFTTVSGSAQMAPGAKYQFKVETDDSFGDATIELYANNTHLTADAAGVFTATINSNTLIHANFRQPEPSGDTSPWKITGAAGGVGLVTDVVNVVAGKSFTIRANALAIPSDNSALFYCAALTTKDGAIKELISPIISNDYYNHGNLPANFTCQVKDASIREGNLIRIVSSFDKKKWSIVKADNDSIVDRIDAIGNRVVYHSVNMPEKVEGAVIQGGATQIVRGMPFTLKVTPVSTADRITIAVNGINKVVNAAIANLSIPAVVEDLDIAIQVNPAGADAYTVVNVREGELASKIAACPTRLKVIGVMRSEDFDAFRKNAGTIIDLDLADVTIKGAGDLANAIPADAFASPSVAVRTALKTIILPTNLKNIEGNAFNRCQNLAEITIPASVTYVGAGAFSACIGLKKIIAQGTQPPATGNMSPFPSNTSGITLEVPKGSEDHYGKATFWSDLNKMTSVVYYYISIDPSRMFGYSSFFDLAKIPYPGSKQQVTIGLPSFKPTSYKENPTYRPGAIYKIYDNTSDVTYTSRHRYDYGQYSVEFNPAIADPQYSTCPQNHVLTIVFHYRINFNKPTEITAEFVELADNDKWEKVDMSWFFDGNTERPTLYRESRDYKFRLLTKATNVDLNVVATSKVLTKSGANPEYETRTQQLVPDENGVYTLTDLQGDTEINVTSSLVIENGSTINSDEALLVSKDKADEITDIALSGEIGEEAFKEIRDKFVALETLNLNEVTNEAIPDNAFSNMDKLKSVVVPDNVVSVGSNAFAGCTNLESVTLPAVESIGEGAFKDCGSLTSITILGKAAGGASYAPSRFKAPAARSLTDASFSGLNPNCLIYLPEGYEESVGATANVIVNKADSRVAVTDITLNPEHPFNAPASFSLGEHRISLTIDIPGSLSDDNDGWKGIVLPFAPTEVTYGAEFNKRGDSAPLTLLTFGSEADATMTRAETILPNRPYLASVYAPFEKVPVTFSATGRSTAEEFVYDVNYSPIAEEICARGGEFTLYGGFNGVKDGIDALYVLDGNGVAFNRVDASETAVAPFSVYACGNTAAAAESFTVGTHPVWVFDPTATKESGSKLYRSNTVGLASQTANAEIHYTLDGSEPTASSPAYTEPFTIDGEKVTVKAVAVFKGNLSEPVTLEYGLRTTDINYPLADGWSWISHNVETEIPVSDIIGDNVDRVLSQTEEVVRDSKLGIVGDLTSLKPLEAYKVFTSGDGEARTLKGISFDPATPVSLHAGWNWIGCPIEGESLAMSYLFANLNAEEGDMIVGRAGYAQADAEGNWVGDLSQLQLGQGYMYRSASDKEFTYNTISSGTNPAKSPARRPEVARWNIVSSKYPSVMPVTSRIVKAGGIMAGDGEFEIGAFCGDECRGIGVYVDGWMMISVFGNTGDEISFRLLSNVTHSESLLPQKLEFTQEPVGSLNNPFTFDAGATSSIDSINDGSHEVVVENGTLIVKGTDGSIRLVEVYDLAGMKEASVDGSEADSLKIGNLNAGVHIVVIYTDGGACISRKIEIN